MNSNEKTEKRIITVFHFVKRSITMGRGKASHFAQRLKRFENKAAKPSAVRKVKKLGARVHGKSSCSHLGGAGAPTEEGNSNKLALSAKLRLGATKRKSFLQARLGRKMKQVFSQKKGTNDSGEDDKMDEDDNSTGAPASSSGTSLLQNLAPNSIAQRQQEFELKIASQAFQTEEQQGFNKNREAENSRRQFYRELRSVINASDVIVQVLDARDPNSCRNRQLEREVASSRGKKMVLLVNKVDLVPREVVFAWEKYLARECPVVLFKCGRRKYGFIWGVVLGGGYVVVCWEWVWQYVGGKIVSGGLLSAVGRRI